MIKNNDKTSILIVDDEASNIDVLVNILKEDYQLQVANSGKKAIEVAKKSSELSIILMDVMMPEMDGYEAARYLKNHPSTQDIIIIFVSAMDSLDSVISGYEAGGSDYLTKPVRPDELLRKIQLQIANKKIQTTIETEKKFAMDTAMTAIVSGGEQGILLNFMRQSFTINSIEKLGKLIVNSCINFELDVSVQLRSADQELHFSQQEDMSPLEIEFLSRVKTAGKFREKRQYFVANYGDVILLVKDMPLEDERRGRLRDHLAILVEGADTRLKSLQVLRDLYEVINTSNKDLQDIKGMQTEFISDINQNMDDVLMDLESSFLGYGLTEDQEDKLLNVVESGIKKSEKSAKLGDAVDNKLKKIVNKLENIAHKIL